MTPEAKDDDGQMGVEEMAEIGEVDCIGRQKVQWSLLG